MTLPRDKSLELQATLEYYGLDFVPERRNAPVRCPFHDDSHASGSVDLEAGVYQCHTCGAQGDAIALIEKQEGCDFKSALSLVQSIVDRSGGALRIGPSGEPSGHLPARPNGAKRAYRPSWD